MSIKQLVNHERLENLIIGRAKHKVANTNLSISAVEYGLGATIHYPSLKLICEFWHHLQHGAHLPCTQDLDPLFSGSKSGTPVSLIDVSNADPGTYVCTLNSAHYSNIGKPAGDLVDPHLGALLLSTMTTSAIMRRPSLTLVAHSGARSPGQTLWLILPLSQPAKTRSDRCTHLVFAALPAISANPKAKPKLSTSQASRSSAMVREADDVRILQTVLRDVCPPLPRDAAGALISKFGSLEELALASPERLATVGALTRPQVAAIRATTEISLRLLKSSFSYRPISTIPDVFQDYCRALVGYADKPMVIALFLDSDGYLITQSTISTAASNSALVDIPQIIKLAMRFEAHALILLHNHHNGEVAASQPDIEITRHLETAARNADIVFQDHLMASRTSIVSMRAIGCYRFGRNRPRLEATSPPPRA